MSLQPETMDSMNLFTVTAEDKHITFPFRLHRLLEDAPTLGFDAIVSWMPSGKAFKVHNTKLFEKEIMNRFFNQTRYKSFLRQLNLYGFHREATGTSKGSYSRDFFVQGKASLCAFIRRTKNKKQNEWLKEMLLTPSNEPLKEMLLTPSNEPPSRMVKSDANYDEISSSNKKDFQLWSPPSEFSQSGVLGASFNDIDGEDMATSETLAACSKKVRLSPFLLPTEVSGAKPMADEVAFQGFFIAPDLVDEIIDTFCRA
jgi:hypothetical protein